MQRFIYTSYKLTYKKSEYINNDIRENNKIESVEGSSNIERPGSPRDRW